MSNVRLPQGSGAGGDAGGHNELEEVPNIYQLLNQHPPELCKIFVAINISYNVAETNNSKDKYKYKKNTLNYNLNFAVKFLSLDVSTVLQLSKRA